MIQHIVSYKLKDNSKENKQRVVDTMYNGLKDIPQVKSITVRADEFETERSYDMVLMVTFESKEDMDIYQVNPEHMKVRAMMKEAREASVSIDFTI